MDQLWIEYQKLDLHLYILKNITRNFEKKIKKKKRSRGLWQIHYLSEKSFFTVLANVWGKGATNKNKKAHVSSYLTISDSFCALKNEKKKIIANQVKAKLKSPISRERNCKGTKILFIFLRSYNQESLKQIEDYDFQKVAELKWNDPIINN